MSLVSVQPINHCCGIDMSVQSVCDKLIPNTRFNCVLKLIDQIIIVTPPMLGFHVEAQAEIVALNEASRFSKRQ